MQFPVLYNEHRIWEGPLPRLNFSATEENDPLITVKDEEFVVCLSADDINEVNRLLAEAGEPSTSHNNAEFENASREQTISSIEIVNTAIASSDNYECGDNGSIERDDAICTNEIECMGASTSNEASSTAINNAEVDVAFVNEKDDDDEIEFLGSTMPRPMENLRTGIVKHEDDNISGTLCYKLTVR